MGKTRSSRRMRNCNSRNKRGGLGLFRCTNCSDTKKALKDLQDKLKSENKFRGSTAYLDGINEFYKDFIVYDLHTLHTNFGPDRDVMIRNLYIELNDEDRAEMLNAILIFLMYYNEDYAKKKFLLLGLDFESKSEKVIFSDEDKNKVNTELREKLKELLEKAKQESPEVKQFYAEQEAERVRIEGVRAARAAQAAPSTSGGKSRRRHRRGRTLHKRRKSSKVHKTRRTRSHSRSRR